MTLRRKPSNEIKYVNLGTYNFAIVYDNKYLGKILRFNSVALVRDRTIPTERPPPVGEVSANFCG
jgi:hypothetical protein